MLGWSKLKIYVSCFCLASTHLSLFALSVLPFIEVWTAVSWYLSKYFKRSIFYAEKLLWKFYLLKIGKLFFAMSLSRTNFLCTRLHSEDWYVICQASCFYYIVINVCNCLYFNVKLQCSLTDIKINHKIIWFIFKNFDINFFKCFLSITIL